jgi:uncharacterized protein
VKINALVGLILLSLFSGAGWGFVNPVSLPYIMEKQFNGHGLKILQTISSNRYYTRYYVYYLSGELKLTGIMNVPAGKGPFPVIITAHGHIDPKVYTTGRGLKREQDYLARNGYVVLHPDYRNHNGSDKDPNEDLNLRLGYTEDVINAVYAVKNSDFLFIDKDNIGLLGHSMGGGIALNIMVTKPDLVNAFVLFAPTSIDYRDNFHKWNMGARERDSGEHRHGAQAIIEKYGSPESNPEFWDDLSAKTFIYNVKSPVLLHHGTADQSVPFAWSERLAAAFKERGKELVFYSYPGEKHEFIKAWPLVMRRSVEFFDSYLK